ncbi:PQQ-dependent sugar dehydrogenase [Acidipropionibacterium jensenii]|nr:PQQ-dependent sugar dehydrogenase [Acidipropionibacterium jensenii]
MVGRRTVIAAIPLLLLGACTRPSTSTSTVSPTPSDPATSEAPPPSSAGPSGSPSASAGGSSASAPPAKGSASVVRTLATGLNVPWGMARLPGGDVLVTSRDTAAITRVAVRNGATTALGTVSESVSNKNAGGEGGLLGIAVSPRFASDRQIFIYHSTDSENRIARLRYDESAAAGRQLSGYTAVLTGIPHSSNHNGGGLAFGLDGSLFASTGDAYQPAHSQDRGNLAGKILRITPQGRPASGNPFGGSPVWTMGHRNVQGLGWDRAGRMWASEFGENKADELNLIQKGRNYGWPVVEGRGGDARFTDPVAQWGTDVDSPSGIAVAGGSVWMAALRGQRLWRIPLDGTRPVAAPQSFLDGAHGRLRSVLALDDQTLLVGTSNTDGRGDPRSGDDRLLELRIS